LYTLSIAFRINSLLIETRENKPCIHQYFIGPEHAIGRKGQIRRTSEGKSKVDLKITKVGDIRNGERLSRSLVKKKFERL
jgi:hypothetical protein